MLRALALALLIPLAASAQTSSRVEGARGPIYPGAALKLPLVYSGAPFDCLGATSCVYWNGSALVDSAGLTWTQNGTVPQVAANALPVTAAQGAAGPFSDANYYSYGTGSDPLDSTGDRFGCVAFVPESVGALQTIISNGAEVAAGHYVILMPAGTFRFASFLPISQTVTTSNSVAALGYNVACWWRTGTSINGKLNLGTTASSTAAGAEVAGTSYTLKMGRYDGVGSSFPGTILSVVQGLGACPAAPPPYAATCEGWATYQMTRAFGAVSTIDGGVAVTRTTTNGTATNEVNGIVWNVPNNVPRVTANGLLVERASGNAVLQSSTSCVGNAVQAPWVLAGTPTCVSDASVAPDGTATMDTWTNTVSTDRVGQPLTTASSATFAVSYWSRKAATGSTSAVFRCGAQNATSCSCVMSDGSACTTVTGGTDCVFKSPAVGTPPVRTLGTVTCAAAITNPTLFLAPGEYGSSTGTASFWGAQVETGTSATSYLPTTTVAATRSADVVTVPWPTMPDINRWCVKATVTPYGGRAWGAGVNHWVIGTFSGANSARLAEGTTTIGVRVFDGAGALRSVDFTHGYAAGSVHVVTACNNNGVVTLYSDGALVGSTTTGGTGLWAGPPAPNAIQVGSAADAFSRNVTICKGGSAAQCR